MYIQSALNKSNAKSKVHGGCTHSFKIKCIRTCTSSVNCANEREWRVPKHCKQIYKEKSVREQKEY